ncbi:MAG: OmpA family protein [Elusimicrobia bacterium]|nr:OmpA family protein [Elusimicrobiota bacterium]
MSVFHMLGGYMHLKRSLTIVLMLAVVCGGLSSCSTAKKRKKLGVGADAAATEAANPAYTPAVDVTEASIRGSEFTTTPELATIYFEYDSYALKDEALEALKKNAAYLKDHKDLEVLVAGHCDQRGTIEYNLSLGQNRAKGVREYYIRLGVPGKSVATISYGKESPACAEMTEDCWSKNRRAETRVRSRTASAGAPTGDTQ